MNCDRCENEATVHEVTISDGQVLEVHLCEVCAQETGVVSGSPAPVEEILKKIAAGKAAEPTAACEACGTTFAQFKQAGRLGCPECYQALEKQLGPILDRAHQGAVHHVGKVPKRMMQLGGEGAGLVDRAAALAAAQSRAEQIRRLRADLARAVNAEHYEQAAQIRDRLRQLQHGAGTDSETAEGTA
ncbi:MAG: UvrB/UvrC motif-containing protein [Planctomycetota bacterium]|nr:UvrB/UvrC motif-containing protein [Planctomycetota bacterium]